MNPPLSSPPPPLLLHCCCAPCAVGCVERLLYEERRIVTLYFSNSNLNSEAEFERRLHSVRQLANLYKLELIVDPYDHAAWKKSVLGLETEPERGKRCTVCFAFSLKRTAEEAARQNRHFCTSLTVSPHKNSSVIFSEGGKYQHFEPMDFKKRDGFLKGRKLAGEYGFYLQNYCGCEFSLRSDS